MKKKTVSLMMLLVVGVAPCFGTEYGYTKGSKVVYQLEQGYPGSQLVACRLTIKCTHESDDGLDLTLTLDRFSASFGEKDPAEIAETYKRAVAQLKPFVTKARVDVKGRIDAYEVVSPLESVVLSDRQATETAQTMLRHFQAWVWDMVMPELHPIADGRRRLLFPVRDWSSLVDRKLADDLREPFCSGWMNVDIGVKRESDDKYRTLIWKRNREAHMIRSLVGAMDGPDIWIENNVNVYFDRTIGLVDLATVERKTNAHEKGLVTTDSGRFTATLKEHNLKTRSRMFGFPKPPKFPEPEPDDFEVPKPIIIPPQQKP